MRRLLLLCLLAAGAPFYLASAQQLEPQQQPPQFFCMTGIPCGTGCTMGDGLCIQGRCFDSTGTVEWACMAAMVAPPSPVGHKDSSQTQQQQQQQQQIPQATAAASAAATTASATPADPAPATQGASSSNSFGSSSSSAEPYWGVQGAPRFPSTWQWWSFPSFPSFPAFSPMKPWMMPFGGGPLLGPTPFGNMAPFANCGGNGPCATGQFCDAQGQCRPDDCVSQFKYGCPGDTGELLKVSCPHFSGYKECYASSSSGFKCNKGPAGSSIACAASSQLGGSSSSSGSVWTASAGYQTPTVTTVTTADPTATTIDAVPAAAAATATAMTKSTPTTPAATAPAATAPAATAPAATAPAATAPATAPTTAAAASTAAPGIKQSAFKKISTEAGPTQPAGAAGAASTAASGTKQQLLTAATPVFLVQGADETMPPTSRLTNTPADGTNFVSSGPGPAIGIVDVDPKGNGMAAGMASGDQKTVVTQRGPNGMSSMSSAVSTNGGPAVASSVATSSPTSDQQGFAGQFPTDMGPLNPTTQWGSSSSNPQTPPQGTAVTSRDGGSAGNAGLGDAAKATGAQAAAQRPKSSATGRGGQGEMLWQSAAAAVGAAVLLLVV